MDRSLNYSDAGVQVVQVETKIQKGLPVNAYNGLYTCAVCQRLSIDSMQLVLQNLTIQIEMCSIVPW